MKKSANQIRVELEAIATAHLQINSFHWGDLSDAMSQVQVYPLMNCYWSNVGTTFNKNTTTPQLVVEISDKLYKDDSNLNDVESDIIQIARDVFQVINKSVRWKKLGKVQSSTATKFKHGTPDVVACVSNTMLFEFRDGSGVCDLPMQDYDFDQEVPAGACPQVKVVNSDSTFDVDVDAGNTLNLADNDYSITNSEATVILSGSEVAQKDIDLVLPDIDFTDSDGTTTQEPSGKNLVCTPITPCADASYDVEYANGDPIQSGTIPSGGSETIIVPDPSTPSVGATLLKTGQQTSYAAGDDGDIQAGREVDFFTLNSVPLNSDGTPTANTTINRFTDELGTQTYLNNIVIDWTTFNNVDGTVLGYFRSPNTLTGSDWATAMAFCLAFSVGTFVSGWRNGNQKEIENVKNINSTTGWFNYAPFNVPNGIFIHTSTTNPLSTTQSVFQNFNVWNFTFFAKTTNAGIKPFPVRTFTVTGTIIT